MRWSKLKKLVESRFSPEFAGRLSVHSAAYGNCTCGHCWITLDKKVIANFCTRAFFNTQWGETAKNPMYKEQWVVYGELSRQDAYESMFDYVHSLSLEEALRSDDVLIQALTVVDQRLGKRRLEAIEADSLHPLAKALLAIRKDEPY